MDQLDLFTGKVSEYQDRRVVVPDFDNPGELETFLAHLNIVDVGLTLLGNKVKKQTCGPNYRGLCPFHKEKTASFYLKPKWDFYICYGCGNKGGPLLLDYRLKSELFQDMVNKFGLKVLDWDDLEMVKNSELSKVQKNGVKVLWDAFYKECNQ
jgi:hypothetical protein